MLLSTARRLHNADTQTTRARRLPWRDAIGEQLDNDRAFTVYAVTLIAAVASVITACVASGVATLPTAGVFLEHLALSIGFRTAYKSFDGFDWAFDLADALGLYVRRYGPPTTGAEATA
jgi:hypothetical protein